MQGERELGEDEWLRGKLAGFFLLKREENESSWVGKRKFHRQER